MLHRSERSEERVVGAARPHRPVPPVRSPHPGLLPYLQRQAGNRAVSALVRGGTPVVPAAAPAVQRLIGFEYEVDSVRTRHTESGTYNPMKKWVEHGAGDRMMPRDGYEITADVGSGYSRLEFVTGTFDEASELPRLLRVVDDIVADLTAMTNASAGRPGDEKWVGLDAVPRLKGDWWQQVWHASPRMELVGKLQMTAGFTIDGLRRLMSGSALGDPRQWPGTWNRDARQFVTAYALDREPIEGLASPLYSIALDAVAANGITGKGSKTGARLAGVLAAMAQPALSWRNATFRSGLVQAKTDYAKLLAMVVAPTDVRLDATTLLAALLAVVNANLEPDDRVTGASPVSPQRLEGGVDLSKVTFQQWITDLVPQPTADKPARDLMSGPNYPGTADERKALRAHGPFGDRTDPGDKAVFELRDLMNNPAADLRKLVNVLVKLMRSINDKSPAQPIDVR